MSIASEPLPREFSDERPELFNHLNLPCSDDKPVENFHQPLQAALLSGILTPHFNQLFPGGDYVIGSDNGIYWKLTRPRLEGCKAPDWYVITNVPRLLDGELRRSYVLWQEHENPTLIVEFVSGNGAEERDDTPETGKFWVYERAIRAEYYVIWDPFRNQIEAYRLANRRYRRVSANERGRVAIPPLAMELGSWDGNYQEWHATWLRAWNRDGIMLPSPEELADAETQRAETEKQRAETEKQRAEIEKQRAEIEKQRAEIEKQRAEIEKQRADRFAAKLRELGISPDSL